MRKFTWLILLLSPLGLLAQSFKPVQELIKRRTPWLAGHVVFKPLKSSQLDRFEMKSAGDKLIISASGTNAAAVGLNWYLKYYCNRSMSHMGDNLAAVYPIPKVNELVSVEAPARYRYALNYCTYNYTMSFYDWKDWEHELDWMALNGVNLMLTVNGMESVWQKTLQQIGYSEKEINDFLVGPAYTAWWLMGNIQGWGGPMPQSQINSRKALQQKMIARMKALGISPVLQGFYGMVPASLKDKSKAEIIDQKTWGAFKRPDILVPGRDDFSRIAAIYYSEVRKAYGNDIRFFAGDPFHEGGITEGIDLKAAGKSIQQEMQKSFPGSTWVLQGWQDNPKQQMLEGLDKSHILVQELFGEFTNNWEKRKGYDGTPFIWSVVNNFGERPGLYGKLQRFADEVDRIRKGPYQDVLSGVGIMPEGLDNNPPVYDLMLELGWRKEHVEVKDWLVGYAKYRYGKSDAHINKAWQGFLETIYESIPGYQEGASESVFCIRPALDTKPVSHWGTRVRTYDLVKFKQAVLEFAKAAPAFKNADTYQIDLINMLRQVLANDGEQVFQEMVKAYNEKNTQEFNRFSTQFTDMIRLTDDLLSAHPYYQLNTYKAQALKLGKTAAEKKENIRNAMMLITYWGENNPAEDNLHDYAYKEWGGLMKDYYLARWELYINYLQHDLKGEKMQAPDFFRWERAWVEQNMELKAQKQIKPLFQVVAEILKLKTIAQ
ncbi:alpha-N-acetylglucosaminidase [Pedobacter soli]|uniref:Alpha-N-acetylglucosaminidase n=1 Tax=Pedobacter soli TaxID=390242 RepID=A0A1G6RVC9_9SPHI|nr:alpha-N-acetylglucosaminidase [Pedobacter soli]SDD07885.1 alpha-N-acetylglucosaminidase [Pedobacter soli]